MFYAYTMPLGTRLYFCTDFTLTWVPLAFCYIEEILFTSSYDGTPNIEKYIIELKLFE